MSAKPWDCLRAPAVKEPIRAGGWRTTDASAGLYIVTVDNHAISMRIGESAAGCQLFKKKDLLELAEFCTELANQLN